MKTLPLASLGLAVAVAVIAAHARATESAPRAGAVLARVRFDDAAQDYQGTRYRFLGDGALRLTIDVPPADGHAIDLLWGSKNDARCAVMSVGGKTVELRDGGYDGFGWVRAPLPKGLRGDRYEILLRAGTVDRPAFFGEIRLVDPSQTATSNAKPAAAKIAVAVEPAPAGGGEAFPEMRALWDRQPPAGPSDDPAEAAFREAEKNGRLAAEALFRCRRFVDGWLAHADPQSGLIPRNLGGDRDIWNAKDSAADNYPFMVLTCALTDRAMFEGRMLDMLRAETRLTSRIDRLPDTFRFSTQAFDSEKPNLEAIIFGGSEYVKDGLLPLTEWLGESPWSERMTGILDDVWKNARIETPYGVLPTLNFEVNGDLLQACARLYWFTGQSKYLEWGVRLGDYYLLGDHHPTRDGRTLVLSDHGCEAVNGLSELYVAVSHARPEKKQAYRKPLHELYDAILAGGRNEHGLLYFSFNAQTGEHVGRLCDTWGYDYDGIYTAWLVDGNETYRDAVRQALGNLKEHYTGHNWGGADGYADALEGAINLYNREPIDSAGQWIDSEIRTMWAIQKPDGVIEGWHGDGNFARTTIMYALWKSQGLTVQPWRADVRVGAVRRGDDLLISLAADRPYRGRLVFDRPRHKLNMHLPTDYPRINQFPEWFTVEDGRKYVLHDATSAEQRELSGAELTAGVPVELAGGVERRWRVTSSDR
jgi:hypothetical protein